MKIRPLILGEDIARRLIYVTSLPMFYRRYRHPTNPAGLSVRVNDGSQLTKLDLDLQDRAFLLAKPSLQIKTGLLHI
jgi:hypothetical protein